MFSIDEPVWDVVHAVFVSEDLGLSIVGTHAPGQCPQSGLQSFALFI
jgi:hypothetical protein